MPTWKFVRKTPGLVRRAVSPVRVKEAFVVSTPPNVDLEGVLRTRHVCRGCNEEVWHGCADVADEGGIKRAPIAELPRTWEGHHADCREFVRERWVV